MSACHASGEHEGPDSSMSIFTADALLEHWGASSKQTGMTNNASSFSQQQVTTSDTRLLSIASEETAIGHFSFGFDSAADGRSCMLARESVEVLEAAGGTAGVTPVTVSDDCSTPRLGEMSSSTTINFRNSPGFAFLDWQPSHAATATGAAAPAAARGAAQDTIGVVPAPAIAAGGVGVQTLARDVPEGRQRAATPMATTTTARAVLSSDGARSPSPAVATAGSAAGAAEQAGTTAADMEAAVDSSNRDEVLGEPPGFDFCGGMDWDDSLSLVGDVLRYITGTDDVDDPITGLWNTGVQIGEGDLGDMEWEQ